MGISRPRYYKKQQRYRKKSQGDRFKRGYFTDISEKYVPPKDNYMNQERFPEYRSSWELGFMRYCESSDLVQKWTTESIAIPYIHPGDKKPHRYYPDFFILTENGKYLIEIKPGNQKSSPVNQAKWEAAERWAEKNGFKFLVLTEKELKKWGIIK